MVHRDIKPRNLIVTPQGQVKIMDFGLARLAWEQQRHEGRTPLGIFMGTPEYVATEQAVEARDADIRADIYSLGCTLYYLLSGRPPLEETTALKTVLAQIEKQPDPLHVVRPDVPERLSAVVARMMAKNPAARFQRPADVVQALAPFCRETASEDSPAPSASRFDEQAQPTTPATPQGREGRRKVSSRRWLLAGAAAVLLLLACIIIKVQVGGRPGSGLVQIEIQGLEAGAKVEARLDGKPIDVASLAQPLSLQAGPHELELTLTGQRAGSVKRPFTVQPGTDATASLVVVLKRTSVESEVLVCRPMKYQFVDGSQRDMFAWPGKRLALLTPRRDLDAKVMTQIVDALDRADAFAETLTGRKPRDNPRRTFEGRTTIAVMPNFSAAIGIGGLELEEDVFQLLYEGAGDAGQFNQLVFFYLGYCYWFYGDQLEHKAPDDNPNIVCGYAVFLRFLLMEAAGVQGGPFHGQPFERFRREVEGLLDLYQADRTLTWDNTLRKDRAPANPMNLSGSDLFASFLFRLRKDYGGDEFLKRLWQEVVKRPRAQTTQDAVDNFVIASSLAAKRNLTDLFVKQWRWPVSDRAREFLKRL